MQKKLFFLILLLVYSHLSYSQNSKIKLSVYTGLSYRITPIYIQQQYKFKTVYVFFNEHLQLSGLRFNYGLDLTVKKINIGITYSHTLRYGHIYYLKNLPDTFHAVNQSINNITLDQHISLYKAFRIRNKKFQISFGYSWFNHGSNYSIAYKIKPYAYLLLDDNFRYNGFNSSLSFTSDKIQIGLSMYYIHYQNHKFYRLSSILIPEIKFQYHFPFKISN